MGEFLISEKKATNLGFASRCFKLIMILITTMGPSFSRGSDQGVSGKDIEVSTTVTTVQPGSPVDCDAERATTMKLLHDSTLVPESFFSTPAVLAVKDTIPSWVRSVGSLVRAAVNFCLITDDRLPQSSVELMSTLEDTEFCEEKLHSHFVSFCEQNQGLERLPFVIKLKASQNKAIDGVNVVTNEHNGSPSLPSDGLTNIAAPNGSNPSEEISADSGHSSWSSENKSDDVSSDLDSDASECSGLKRIPGSYQVRSNKISRGNFIIGALEREHKHLTNTMLCVVCMVNTIEVTLLPCGHFIICSRCSERCHECPLCHQKVLAEVKTYLS